MNNELYPYVPIVDRPRLELPNGARLAFYVGLNIEHYLLDRPSVSISPSTAHLVPDPLNYGWRDYGNRVGIWRMIEVFDRYDLRPSVLLNSDACDQYPQIIQAGMERNWGWVAHGLNNSVLHATLPADEERAILITMVDAITASVGKRPRGWLGPALNASFNTPALLAELGFEYILDWCADDQPFDMNVEGHQMTSIPYSIEVNDVTRLVRHGMTGPEFCQLLVDQFDTLYREGAETGRVMAVALHPFVIGQAFRLRYLDQALDYIKGHEGVWYPTTDEILDWYLASHS